MFAQDREQVTREETMHRELVYALVAVVVLGVIGLLAFGEFVEVKKVTVAELLQGCVLVVLLGELVIAHARALEAKKAEDTSTTAVSDLATKIQNLTKETNDVARQTKAAAGHAADSAKAAAKALRQPAERAARTVRIAAKSAVDILDDTPDVTPDFKFQLTSVIPFIEKALDALEPAMRALGDAPDDVAIAVAAAHSDLVRIVAVSESLDAHRHSVMKPCDVCKRAVERMPGAMAALLPATVAPDAPE